MTHGNGGWHPNGRPQETTVRGQDAHERRTGRRSPTPAVKTRIVIVDGHTLFRRGVRNILELEGDIEVVGEAGSGREAIATVEELTPDVVLMDLTLPAPNGIETTQRMKRELPHTGVIVLAAERRRGPALRGHQGRRRRLRPQGHRPDRPDRHHPPRPLRRVPDQRQGLQPSRPSPAASSRSSASWPSTARMPSRSSPRSRRARSRSWTTSPRA